MPRQEYTDFINLLTQQEEMKASVVANLIATGWIMQMAPENEPIKRDQINKTAGKLIKEPSFTALMTDPRTAELAKQGKVVELQTLLAEKATMIDEAQSFRKVAHGPENARGDNEFLKSAIKNLNDQVKTAPRMKEKQSQRFKEMIMQVVKKYPRAQLCGTTLRQVVSASEHLWGAIVYSKGKWFVEEPRPISVLDRIGGGDGFTGGLLYGVIQGWDAEKCLQFGWASGVMAASSLNDYAEPADEKQVWDVYAGNARVQR